MAQIRIGVVGLTAGIEPGTCRQPFCLLGAAPWFLSAELKWRMNESRKIHQDPLLNLKCVTINIRINRNQTGVLRITHDSVECHALMHWAKVTDESPLNPVGLRGKRGSKNQHPLDPLFIWIWCLGYRPESSQEFADNCFPFKFECRTLTNWFKVTGGALKAF